MPTVGDKLILMWSEAKLQDEPNPWQIYQCDGDWLVRTGTQKVEKEELAQGKSSFLQ